MSESISEKCKRLGFKPHGLSLEQVTREYSSCQSEPIADALWDALRDSVKTISKGRAKK